MRIAFFVHAFPEISETFILRQVTGLLDRGHDVAIFADQPSSSTEVHEDVVHYRLDASVYPLARPAGAFAAASAVADITLRWPRIASRYVRGTPDNSKAERLRDLAAGNALRKHTRFDVVHCHFGDIGIRFRYVAELWRAPLVVSFYGFDCALHAAWRWRERYRALRPAVTAATVLSEHMKARIADFGFPPERLHVVPLCVDTDRFSVAARPATARSSSAVRILSVARLVEKKGLEYALHAFARVATLFPDIHYDIIGDGPLRQQLDELARTLRIADRVVFHGVRTESAVRDAMLRADVFLLPSVTARSGDEEGTPTVLLEAASCGVPVVSSMHAGIPEIVVHGETGLLAPERDVDALSHHLERLIGSATLRARMGAAARERVVSRHDCRQVSAQLEAVYDEARHRTAA